jgi:hypothetical protein
LRTTLYNYRAEGIPPEKSEFSSASLSGTDTALPHLTEQDKLIQKRGERPRDGERPMLPLSVEGQAPLPPLAYHCAQARSRMPYLSLAIGVRGKGS